MPVIYIDVLFFINFIFDSSLLVLTGSLSAKPISPFRIIAGGVFGGIYGIFLFFGELGFLGSGIIMILASAVMTAIAYAPLSKKDFFRLLVSFYLSAFLLGGALSSLFYFSGRPGIMSSGIYYFPMSTFQLLVFALPLTLVLYFSWKKMKNRLLSYGNYCTVILSCGEKTVFLDGLIDSGCSLTDPYLKKPVIIIEKDSAEKLLQGKNTSFRLIPYSTVSSSSEMMKAFSPDSCLIRLNSGEFYCNCTVGISPVCSGGKAIINPAVLGDFGGMKNDLQRFS